MNRFIAFVLAALVSSGAAFAQEHPALDRFPTERLTELPALQNGARLFANYCMSCHSASYMRYNRMRDIGLSEDEIAKNLMFAPGAKVGDLMKISMAPKDAKAFFGTVPPDLTVITRSRNGEGGSGADYVYTYLRSFYRDETRPTGWNNRVFPNVGMPHVLWELQGTQEPIFEEEKGEDGHVERISKGFKLVSAGTMSPAEYDSNVADLVAYLEWMGEPAHRERVRIGVAVLIGLLFLWIFAWRLNAAYWKDVK